VGAPADPFEISVLPLIGERLSIRGWPSGTAADSADTLRFATLFGVRPMIEVRPLADAQAAYEKMMRNKARFRMVLAG